jgi:hypothetical protein
MHVPPGARDPAQLADRRAAVRHEVQQPRGEHESKARSLPGRAVATAVISAGR